jgi:XTP/dITP diphosphohydrolase
LADHSELEQDGTMTQQHPQLEELIAVLERLRAPGGCAWDREQTHESLVRYLLEETYELIDAIESGNREEMIEELGDVLYQVIFHSDIAAHTPGEEFTLEDVAANMTAKMIGRHPHVFGDATAETADDVMAVWDDLKRVEKPTRTSVLDGVPQGMPALALADKLLGKAHKLGITRLESAEVTAVVTAPAAAKSPTTMPATMPATIPTTMPAPETEQELGDLLLSIVATARSNGLDAERALRASLRELQDDMRAAE